MGPISFRWPRSPHRLWALFIHLPEIQICFFGDPAAGPVEWRRRALYAHSALPTRRRIGGQGPVAGLDPECACEFLAIGVFKVMQIIAERRSQLQALLRKFSNILMIEEPAPRDMRSRRQQTLITAIQPGSRAPFRMDSIVALAASIGPPGGRGGAKACRRPSLSTKRIGAPSPQVERVREINTFIGLRRLSL